MKVDERRSVSGLKLRAKRAPPWKHGGVLYCLAVIGMGIHCPLAAPCTLSRRQLQNKGVTNDSPTADGRFADPQRRVGADIDRRWRRGGPPGFPTMPMVRVLLLHRLRAICRIWLHLGLLAEAAPTCSSTSLRKVRPSGGPSVRPGRRDGPQGPAGLQPKSEGGEESDFTAPMIMETDKGALSRRGSLLSEL